MLHISSNIVNWRSRTYPGTAKIGIPKWTKRLALSLSSPGVANIHPPYASGLHKNWEMSCWTALKGQHWRHTKKEPHDIPIWAVGPSPCLGFRRKRPQDLRKGHGPFWSWHFPSAMIWKCRGRCPKPKRRIMCVSVCSFVRLLVYLLVCLFLWLFACVFDWMIICCLFVRLLARLLVSFVSLFVYLVVCVASVFAFREPFWGGIGFKGNQTKGTSPSWTYNMVSVYFPIIELALWVDRTYTMRIHARQPFQSLHQAGPPKWLAPVKTPKSNLTTHAPLAGSGHFLKAHFGQREPQRGQLAPAACSLLAPWPSGLGQASNEFRVRSGVKESTKFWRWTSPILLWMVAKSISHHPRNPRMIRFPCKYQPTMASHFKVVPIGFRNHPQSHLRQPSGSGAVLPTPDANPVLPQQPRNRPPVTLNARHKRRVFCSVFGSCPPRGPWDVPLLCGFMEQPGG